VIRAILLIMCIRYLPDSDFVEGVSALKLKHFPLNYLRVSVVFNPLFSDIKIESSLVFSEP
jgi:hypothetical protein